MFEKTIQITPKLLWAAITALAVIISAAVAVTWEVRRDYLDELKSQLETYQQSESWKLPETLQQIKNASSALSLELAERAELDKLRKENGAIQTEKQRLASDLQAAEQKLAETQSALEKLLLKAQTFELTEGESAALVENNVYLGLRSYFSSWVSVTLQNQSLNLHVGESTGYAAGNKRCTVTLVKLSAGKKASFTNSCS